MPLKGKNNLAVILDNLDEFSSKLLAQIANESIEGRQHLLQAITQAHEKYNLPIEAHITGWFYYFSRTRGPTVKKALDDIEIEANPISRLELFKKLLVEGEWNVGSFNYHLFLELINGVPGYEPLDEESAAPIIKRMNTLLLKKTDNFIGEFKANQRLIEEREKSRQALQKAKEHNLDNIVLEGSLLSAQHAAKLPYRKISFYLVKEERWTLSWIDAHGTSFKLSLSEELERYLSEQNIEKIETINLISAKRIKNECLKIRDVFFDKMHVLVNPKQPKTGAELSNEELGAQGTTNSFVLRSKEGLFSVYWINTLGKSVQIDLASYSNLSEFLAGQNEFIAENLIQVKAYLSQVNTAHALGMDDFKMQLQNCLLNRTAPKEVEAPQAKRLDLSHFKDLERCIGRRSSQKQTDETETEAREFSEQAVVPVQKLNFSKYSTVATLFAHRVNAHRPDQAVNAQWVDDAPPPFIENHL